jgi:hypothetical protein
MPFGELFVASPNRRPAQNNKGNGNKGQDKRPQVAGRTAKILGGDEIKVEEMSDPRDALMDWLRDESNPYCRRTSMLESSNRPMTSVWRIRPAMKRCWITWRMSCEITSTI